jgi:hypothetical protein
MPILFQQGENIVNGKFKLLLSAASLAVAFGCAEERPAINRVQPFALEKTYFVGQDILDTSDDPEFWTQATLVDVGYGASQDGLFTSTYAQPMSRVKWQITEQMLIARIAYERITGTDGKGTGGPVQDGNVVAAFAIDSHFDVVNAYNSTTGERLNILEENTRDRPWNERQYIRVDWSRNLSTDNYDFDTLSLVGLYGGVQYEPMQYDVSDPNDPDAPVFDFDKGYFDITSKAFARPQMIDLSSFGWGIKEFPACYLDPDFLRGSGPAAQCSPVELTIRHSFRKVEDQDYEPEDWDGYRFQSYGAFFSERTGYASNYGLVDDMWHRFINRYDIWERSHFYANAAEMTGKTACFTPETTPPGADPHRDENKDGTEDECVSVGPGSKCDEFRQACTLPFRSRTERPVVWHYSTGSNMEYFESTRLATLEWDVALRMAVNTARYAECVNTGEDAAECMADYPVHTGQQDKNEDAVRLAEEVEQCRIASGEATALASCLNAADTIAAKRGYSDAVIAIAKRAPMVVLCHSPVEAGDPAACGDDRLPAGVTAADCEADAACTVKKARIGDLRYHLVNVMTTPQTPSPWGIMVDAVDPINGQTISASINVWGHVNELWSQKVIDQMRYIAGELTTEEVTEGQYVRDFANAARSAAGGGMTAGLTKNQANNRVMDFATQTAAFKNGPSAFEAAQNVDPDHSALPPEVLKQAQALKNQMRDVRFKFDAASVMRPIYSARAATAAGTDFEAQLMTPMMQEAMGVAGMTMTDSVMDRASMLRGGNRSFQRDLFNLKENALAARGSCMLGEAPAPLSVTGLGDLLQKKFGDFNPSDSEEVQLERAEKMRRYLARKAHYAVVVHEMGHSIGLRHNFVSSSDAYNYRPQYWQLRTKNGAVTTKCTDINDDSEDCIGPRYHDKMTQAERDNMIWMFMHSSVMDYAGEATQDMLGLGAYDFAAARMFYGESVAVYADESFKNGTPRGEGVNDKTDNFGGILGFTWNIGGRDDSMHYTELQENFDLITDCKAVSVEDFKPDTWDETIYGVWEPTLDGTIIKVDGEYSRCSQQKVDYVPWLSLSLPGGEGFYRGGINTDKQDRLRVPYGFGTDGWADLGNLSVYRHDNGADPYELFSFFIAQQEINHIFDNYRRGRSSFSIRGAYGRTLGRYNEKMRDGAKGLGLMKNIYHDFALTLGYNPEQFWQEIAGGFFKENILAAGLAFDHFTMQLQRPSDGIHFATDGDSVLRSAKDYIGNDAETSVIIPNGATGFVEQVGIGGRPVENDLADDKGEFDSRYTVNAGSYYEKAFSAYLLTESVDNFISSSRTDFVDARSRSISMADVFPDGFRRWFANNLTNDDELKGARLVAGFGNLPRIDGEGYPSEPIGFTTWWGSTPRTCFPNSGNIICGHQGNEDGPDLGGAEFANTVALDPQVGWEQQKLLIANTLLYLPENQKVEWLDMMHIWELGTDADPEFTNRIEFHMPTGRTYIAKTFGTEVIFGKTVQRGIAARVLEYANELLNEGYETDAGPDLNGDGAPDWYIARINADTGEPIVRYDPTVATIANGFVVQGVAGCNAQSSENCSCAANRSCLKLEDYASVPTFLRDALMSFGFSWPGLRGVY